MLPFDRRVVQLYGSCTQDGNILLVLELMQVTDDCCKCPLFGQLVLLQMCVVIKCIYLRHVLMLHASWYSTKQTLLFQAATDCHCASSHKLDSQYHHMFVPDCTHLQQTMLLEAVHSPACKHLQWQLCWKRDVIFTCLTIVAESLHNITLGLTLAGHLHQSLGLDAPHDPLSWPPAMSPLHGLFARSLS